MSASKLVNPLCSKYSRLETHSRNPQEHLQVSFSPPVFLQSIIYAILCSYESSTQEAIALRDFTKKVILTLQCLVTTKSSHILKQISMCGFLLDIRHLRVKNFAKFAGKLLGQSFFSISLQPSNLQLY